METRYDLVFEGQISADCSPEDARRNLAKLLRQEPHKVEALFSGKPYCLRRALDPEAAYRYRGAMKHAGLICRLVPTNEVIPIAERAPAAAAATTDGIPAPPKAKLALAKTQESRPEQPAPPKAKLDLAKPKLELLPTKDSPPAPTPSHPVKPSPATPALRECPKCRYHARGHQDGLISQGVCPACGLIIAKYLERQAALNRPQNHRPEAALAPDLESAKSNPNTLYFEELPPGPLKLMSLEFTLPPDITLPDHPKRAPIASLKRRFLATIATYFSLSFLMAGPILLGTILLLALLNVALHGTDDLDSARRTINNFENYELIIRIGLWLLGLWLGLIYLPGKWDGLTYGQRLMRIAPVRKDDDAATLPDTRTLLQRLAGNIMALLIWPVALLWLLFGRSRRSIADRLSDCRQIEVGAAPDSPVLKALSPLAYAILLGFVAAAPFALLANCAGNTLQEIASGKKSPSFSERMLGKEPFDQQKIQETLMSRAAKKEEFGSPQVMLERLVELQRQYYAHHRRYSNDIEELVMEAPDRQAPMMLAILMRQQPKIQLTADGFAIGLHRDDGWHIATKEGYQGVQPSF